MKNYHKKLNKHTLGEGARAAPLTVVRCGALFFHDCLGKLAFGGCFTSTEKEEF